MNHILKIWPQYFARVQDGSKTFELRENDRGFQPGDTVLLSEWDPTEVKRTDSGPHYEDEWMEPKGYTGRTITFKIGYVLPIENNRVVFSLLQSGL